MRNHTIQIAPCSPAMDEWSWEMVRLCKEYREKYPESKKSDDELYREFESVNPRPQPITMELPSPGQLFLDWLRGLKPRK